MKIAILAYGSLVMNLQSRYYETPLRVVEAFEESGLLLQTSFQDLSCGQEPDRARVCLLATSEPSLITRPTKLYYACHEFEDFDQALDNFMQREGTDDPSHIAIIRSPKSHEPSYYCRESFNPQKIEEMERWVLENGFDLAMIAQFPPRSSVHEIQTFLKRDSDVQKRTLIYFLGLPEATQKTHKDALEYLGLDFEESSISDN